MTVVLLRPNGAGASSGHTAVGASPLYACVDESVANSDTDYAQALVVGGFGVQLFTSLYALENLPATLGEVTLVRTVYVARRETTGNQNNERHLLRIGSSIYADDTNALDAVYTAYTSSWGATSPATGVAWTVAEINAMQGGHRSTVEDDGFADTENRITQFYVEVTYSESYQPDTPASMTMTGLQPEFMQGEIYIPSDTPSMRMMGWPPAFMLEVPPVNEIYAFNTRVNRGNRG